MRVAGTDAGAAKEERYPAVRPLNDTRRTGGKGDLLTGLSHHRPQFFIEGKDQGDRSLSPTSVNLTVLKKPVQELNVSSTALAS